MYFSAVEGLVRVGFPVSDQRCLYNRDGYTSQRRSVVSWC